MQRVKLGLNSVVTLHDWYLLKFENHDITQIPGCQFAFKENRALTQASPR